MHTSGKSFTLPLVIQLSQRKEEVLRRYKLFAKAFMGKALRNATQAAIMAGYPAKSASSQGYELLRIGEVRRLLRLEAERAARKMDVTPERVINELGKLAFANVADYTDDSGQFVGMDVISRDSAAAIQELVIDEERRTDGRSGTKRKAGANATKITRVRMKLASKTTALELLGKHWNLYGDRDGGSQTAVKVIVMNSPRPAFDALEEAKRVAALPDGDPDSTASQGPPAKDADGWDGYGGPDVLPGQSVPVRPQRAESAEDNGDEPEF